MFLLPPSYWEVRRTRYTTDKGRGVFARKNIPAGTIIGDYIGKIIPAKDEDQYEKPGELYLMYYHDRATIYPEKNSTGIHLINHSCAPNCWIYTYKGHTLYFTIRKIFKGEELTVSYQMSPQDKECNPCEHACYCNSSVCTQTMHLSNLQYKKWLAFDNANEKRTKRARVTIGEMLKPLSSYPKRIPDHKMYKLFGAEEKKPLVLKKKTLPEISEIRYWIRQTGRPLTFPNLRTTILGVTDNFLTTKAY